MATARPDLPQLHSLIRERCSRRAYSSRPISREVLATLLEAARWASSSRNEQPWRYIVVPRESEHHAKLVACLSASNKQWAPKAPVLLLTVAEVTDPQTGKPRRHAYYDVGQANAQLCLQATALGLSARTMGGFDFEAARAAFAIPAGFDPVTVLAIGYPDEVNSLPADLRERELAPRTRRPLAETVFVGAWGKPVTL